MSRYTSLILAAALTFTSVILAHGKPHLALPILGVAICLALFAFRK